MNNSKLRDEKFTAVSFTREEVSEILHIDPASITEDLMLDIASNLEEAIKNWNSDTWSETISIVASKLFPRRDDLRKFSVPLEITRFDLEYVIGEKANLLSDEQMEQVSHKMAELIVKHEEAFNDYLRLAYRDCKAE